MFYLLVLSAGMVVAFTVTLTGEARPLAPWSPAILAAAVTCFGGAGILARVLFHLPASLSLVAATLFSLLSMTLFLALAGLARRSSEERAAFANVVGALAEVITPIAPGHAGKIVTGTTRPALTLVAISRGECELAPGATVVVTGVHGDCVEVAPLPRGAPIPTRSEREA